MLGILLERNQRFSQGHIAIIDRSENKTQNNKMRGAWAPGWSHGAEASTQVTFLHTDTQERKNWAHYVHYGRQNDTLTNVTPNWREKGKE